MTRIHIIKNVEREITNYTLISSNRLKKKKGARLLSRKTKEKKGKLLNAIMFLHSLFLSDRGQPIKPRSRLYSRYKWWKKVFSEETGCPLLSWSWLKTSVNAKNS